MGLAGDFDEVGRAPAQCAHLLALSTSARPSQRPSRVDDPDPDRGRCPVFRIPRSRGTRSDLRTDARASAFLEEPLRGGLDGNSPGLVG